MLTEDNLMRQLRIFTAAIAKALGMKAQTLYQDALWVLDQSMEEITGVRSDLFHTMDDESAMASLQGVDNGYIQRLNMIADLYWEESQIYKILTDDDEYLWRVFRSLNFFLESGLRGDLSESASSEGKIHQIVDSIGLQKIPSDILFPLYAYEAQIDQPGRAVESLILLLKKTGSPDDLKVEARMYIAQLEQKKGYLDHHGELSIKLDDLTKMIQD